MPVTRPFPDLSPRGHLAIITAPLPGHLNPVQVLAGLLIEQGWQVSIVHLGAARRFVIDPRIGFHALPDDSGETLDAYLAALVAPRGPVRLSRMIRATANLSDRLLADAPAVLERIGATAVLADAVEFAGPLIARKLRLPHAVAVTGLPLLREADVPPPFLDWRFRPDPIGRFRNRSGYAVTDWLMRPVTRVLEARRREWKLEGPGEPPRIQVAQCPRGLDYPRRALPACFRYGAPWRSAEPEAVDLPDDGRPLIFCSLGTLQGARPDLFGVMAQACASIGARAIIGHGGGLSLAEEAALPGAPLVRAFWPQTAVLRRCAAAVLHGGFNSVLDALAAGVPIVALPIGFEQPATAARLDWIGAARVLSPRGLTAPALANALRDVIDQPKYRSASQRVAAEIAGVGGAAAAASAITAALASA
jgi:UDP:flavonoid glycosyltransferase YjiC (YdhE family)